MNICYYCGKGVLYGRSHTHHRGVAGGRWKKRAPKTRRIFQPNLQRVDILEKGKTKRVKLCTKCLKRIKKDITEGKRPFVKILKLIKDQKNQDTKKEKTISKQLSQEKSS